MSCPATTLAAPTAATVYRLRVGRDEVQARPIAYLPVRGSIRVVARDAADRLHVLDVTETGAALVAGPVSPADALAAAERAVAGLPDHGSVTALIGTLSVALVALTADRDREREREEAVS